MSVAPALFQFHSLYNIPWRLIDLYIASHTQGGQDKSKHRHRCQCPSLSGYGAKGGGQMVPPAHPRHAAICFVTRLPGWRSRPPPWWAMVGSLRESISSYATIYAPAAAHCVDHCSLIAPPSATSCPAAVCGARFISPDHFRSQAALVVTRAEGASAPPPRSHSRRFSTHQ